MWNYFFNEVGARAVWEMGAGILWQERWVLTREGFREEAPGAVPDG